MISKCSHKMSPMKGGVRARKAFFPRVQTSWPVMQNLAGSNPTRENSRMAQFSQFRTSLSLHFCISSVLGEMRNQRKNQTIGIDNTLVVIRLTSRNVEPFSFLFERDEGGCKCLSHFQIGSWSQWGNLSWQIWNEEKIIKHDFIVNYVSRINCKFNEGIIEWTGNRWVNLFKAVTIRTRQIFVVITAEHQVFVWHDSEAVKLVTWMLQWESKTAIISKWSFVSEN